MMSARFVDALKGYEYYLRLRGKPDLNQINQYLKENNWNSISLRSYSHYRNLLRHGFRTYIPINKFDVFRSLGRLQMVSDRRRYHREQVEEEIMFSFDNEFWEKGIIKNISIVGFALKIPFNKKLIIGQQSWIRKKGYRDIPATIVWIKKDKVSVIVGLRAFEFIGKFQLTEKDIDSQRLKGILKISRAVDGNIEWNHILRILAISEELMDGITEFIYSLDDFFEENIKIAQPVLSSINFGSPGDAQIKIDLGIAEILRLLIEKVQFWNLERRKINLENRKLELENIELELEIMRKAIKFKNDNHDSPILIELLKFLPDTIKKVFNSEKIPIEILEEGSPERAILNERVIPPLIEILEGDDPDFNVDVSINE